MQFTEATTLNRKSGGAKWRDLRFSLISNETQFIPCGFGNAGGRPIPEPGPFLEDPESGLY
jgi:hypothetical protein